jgi:hypothetical protein
LADPKKYSSRFLHEKCWPEPNEHVLALATQLGLRTVNLDHVVSQVQVVSFPNLHFITRSLTKFAYKNASSQSHGRLCGLITRINSIFVTDITEFAVCFAKIQQVALLDGHLNSTHAYVWIPSERGSINKGWPLYVDKTSWSGKLRTALVSRLVEFYEIEATRDFNKRLKSLLGQAFDPKLSMKQITQSVEDFEEEFEDLFTAETPQRTVRTKERITTSGPPPPPPDLFDLPAEREEVRKSFPASPYKWKGYGIRDSDEDSEEGDESEASDEGEGNGDTSSDEDSEEGDESEASDEGEGSGDTSSDDEQVSNRTDSDKISDSRAPNDPFSGLSSPSHVAPTQPNTSPQSAPPQARPNSLDDTPPKPRGSVPSMETYQKMKEQGNAGEAAAAKYLRDKFPKRQVVQSQDGSACDFTVSARFIKTEYFEVKTKTDTTVKFEMSKGELAFAKTKKDVYSILFYPNFDAAASKEVGYAGKPTVIPGTDLFDESKYQVVPTHYQVKKL